MKTVKELENQLNISKVSIYNMLKKPEFKGHTFKGDKNVTLIDEVAEELLKAYYLREQNETIKDIITEELKQEEAEAATSNQDSKSDSKDNGEIKNPDIIRILQDQLQIKDKQIDNLLSIVLNQQKLQGVQLLSDNQNPIKSDEVSPDPEKKGFFSKLFKK